MSDDDKLRETVQRWLATPPRVAPRDPEQETGRFWTAGDGDFIAVAREFFDDEGRPAIYLEHLEPFAPPEETP